MNEEYIKSAIENLGFKLNTEAVDVYERENDSFFLNSLNEYRKDAYYFQDYVLKDKKSGRSIYFSVQGDYDSWDGVSMNDWKDLYITRKANFTKEELTKFFDENLRADPECFFVSLWNRPSENKSEKVNGFTVTEMLSEGEKEISVVLKVEKDDLCSFVRFEGKYDSWAGESWESKFTIVEPKEVTVTKYFEVLENDS